MNRFDTVAGPLNDRPLCREICVCIRKFKAHRGGCQYLESLRCTLSKRLCGSKAIGKQTRASRLRPFEAVENLQSRNRIAIWIVGVDAKSEVGKRQVVRVGNRPDVKDSSVIRLSNPTNHGSDFENSRVFRRDSG